MSSPYSMMQTQVPVVYTATRAYNMMIGADYYVGVESRTDGNISSAHEDLYMAPMPQQAAAVFDFLMQNAGKFEDNLETFYSANSGGHNASSFLEGYNGQFTAVMKEGRELGGHVDAQHLVVYSRPDHVRKVRFSEVAFMRPVVAPRMGRADSRDAPGRAPAAGASRLESMKTLLTTL